MSKSKDETFVLAVNALAKMLELNTAELLIYLARLQTITILTATNVKGEKLSAEKCFELVTKFTEKIENTLIEITAETLSIAKEQENENG